MDHLHFMVADVTFTLKNKLFIAYNIELDDDGEMFIHTLAYPFLC